MIRYCCVHKGIFGIKRPWFSFAKTHGICPKCLPGELKKIERILFKAEQIKSKNGV